MAAIKNLVSAAALMAGMAFAGSAANAVTVINFDVDGLGAPIAANTPITNQYANLGVIFEGLENGSPFDINAAPDPDLGPVPSSPNALTNCSDALNFCAGNRADIVRITFASAVSQISLMLNSLGGLSVTFELYDSANSLLETQTVTSGGSSYVPLTFSASGVSRIDGLQPEEGWAWAMDDLTYSAVPLPATLGLLGAGIAGLAAFGRRKTA